MNQPKQGTRGRLFVLAFAACLLALAAIRPAFAEGACAFYTYDGCESCTPADVEDSGCPDWVKGWGQITPVSEVGINGYFAFIDDAYEIRHQTLVISPISHYEETRIPVEAASVDISDDGDWLLVNIGEKGYLMKKDGSNQVAAPFDYSNGEGVKADYVFYRSSPYGQEIVRATRENEIRSIPVEFSSGEPEFGNERTIATSLYKYGYNGRDEIAVAGDYLMARIGGGHGAVYKIPDGGRGTITWDEKHTIYSSKPVCGVTLSHGAVFALHNAGFEDFAPKEYIPKHHKGFVVHEPKSEFTDADYDRISINWAPRELCTHWRYADEEFHHHAFSNHYEWLITKRSGNLTENDRGVFIVHWPTNRWVRVALKTITASQPALFLSEGKKAQRSEPADVAAPTEHIRTPRMQQAPQSVTTELYDLYGRRLGKQSNGVQSRAHGVVIVRDASKYTIRTITK